MTPQKNSQKSAARPRTTKGRSKVFTDEERAAMKEYVREKKGGARSSGDGESEVLAKIAEMPDKDRVIAERIHEIVTASAPELTPRTWYGMPAYSKGGKVLCFFQHSGKFKTRYSTFGFSDTANLDEGAMWPVGFALTELTAAEEERIAALVKRAAS